MKIYLTFITITLMAFFSGCKTTQPTTSNAALQETYWKLFEIMGKPVSTPADAKQVHIKFQKG
ncbi:MAG: hypothetical protein IPJ81_11315 [Chitinophagaceae bacterium]|nr:hypothetical protein [Chitinophagaceae bacterium]